MDLLGVVFMAIGSLMGGYHYSRDRIAGVTVGLIVILIGVGFIFSS
jgi:hypothetical protein